MVEPLACCLRGVERAAIQPGDRVAILGAGPIGLMLSACVADAGGGPRSSAVDRSGARSCPSSPARAATGTARTS